MVKYKSDSKGAQQSKAEVHSILRAFCAGNPPVTGEILKHALLLISLSLCTNNSMTGQNKWENTHIKYHCIERGLCQWQFFFKLRCNHIKVSFFTENFNSLWSLAKKTLLVEPLAFTKAQKTYSQNAILNSVPLAKCKLLKGK